MKNLQYPVKGFRLHPETIKKLAEIKKDSGLSYNRLIFEMIGKYNGRKSN